MRSRPDARDASREATYAVAEEEVMGTITISVSDLMRAWVETRVVNGAYVDAGEYLRDLIRRDQEDGAERDALVSALSDGEASGVSERRAPDILAALRRELSGDAV